MYYLIEFKEQNNEILFEGDRKSTYDFLRNIFYDDLLPCLTVCNLKLEKLEEKWGNVLILEVPEKQMLVKILSRTYKEVNSCEEVGVLFEVESNAYMFFEDIW